MEREIVEAVQALTQMTIWYPPGERLIEPHAIGRSRDGNLLLRAYQVSGASASGEHEHWKLFRVDKIGSAESGEPFGGPRPGYRQGDRAMKDGIIAQL